MISETEVISTYMYTHVCTCRCTAYVLVYAYQLNHTYCSWTGLGSPILCDIIVRFLNSFFSIYSNYVLQSFACAIKFSKLIQLHSLLNLVLKF